MYPQGPMGHEPPTDPNDPFAETFREIKDRKENERQLWRLGKMVRAVQTDIEEGDLALLEGLAAGFENLWDITSALAVGCPVRLAARIYAPLEEGA